MAHGKRLTDTSKWDDSFYRNLPGDLKCVWEYMLDHVDSIGVVRIDFQNLEHFIKPTVPLTRFEFDRHFGGRVVWLTPEKGWLPGYVAWTYGELTPTNRVHRGLARKVCEATKGVELSGKALEVRTSCEGVTNPLRAPLKGDAEGAPTPQVPHQYKNQHQHQNQDQDLVFKKGGMGENKRDRFTKAQLDILDDQFEASFLKKHLPDAIACWDAYDAFRQSQTPLIKTVQTYLKNERDKPPNPYDKSRPVKGIAEILAAKGEAV